MLIADFDADGKIVGIELVGPAGQKPCQSWLKRTNYHDYPLIEILQ
jgi:uncharacterized protein YuzE